MLTASSLARRPCITDASATVRTGRFADSGESAAIDARWASSTGCAGDGGMSTWGGSIARGVLRTVGSPSSLETPSSTLSGALRLLPPAT